MSDLDTNHKLAYSETNSISIFPISQATNAKFIDLYFRNTALFFIQKGSKRVLIAVQGEIVGQEGDLMIFPSGTMVTMENRPVLNEDYRAVGVSFAHDLVGQVFTRSHTPKAIADIQILRDDPYRPNDILELTKATVSNHNLPESIRERRLLEPLIWLREQGVILPTHTNEQPNSSCDVCC